MAVTSDGVHSSVKAIQNVEAACARFARALVERLPEVERELRQATEDLETRNSDLRHEIADLENQISSAEEDADLSSERRQLEEAQDKLASVQRSILRLVEVGANYTQQAHKVEHLATAHAVQAREFLNGAADDLKAYLAKNIEDAEHFDTVPTEVNSVATLRTKIRDAQYIQIEPVTGGLNKGKLILRNGVSVFFKPMDGEFPFARHLGIPPRTQYCREKAASLIDELLGLNLVPPTEIIVYKGRTDEKDRRGSAQLLQEGFNTAARLYRNGIIEEDVLNKLADRQRHDWQLFDELTGQGDRHIRNWMLRPRQNGGFDLALIDNGCCLRSCEDSFLVISPAAREQIDDVNRKRLEHFLTTKGEWRPVLCELVGAEAVNYMVSRAENLLNRGYYSDGDKEPDLEQNSYSPKETD